MKGTAMKRPRRFYRTSRGSWVPARLTGADLLLVVWASLFQVWIRVFDYTTGSDSGSRSLTLVERAFPLPVWGAAFGLGAVILLIGTLDRRHLVVWLGHFYLASAYTLLGLGILISVLMVPWANGIRGAGVLILPTIMHWVFAKRTGPKPLRSRESRSAGESLGEPK